VKIGLISPKGVFLGNAPGFREILANTGGKVAHRDY
jgi:hypothetical protein